MGVRGLRTFIGERVRVLKRTLPHGSMLVIDGDGWMFHFIQQCGEGLRMDTGGQYEKYASAIFAEIRKLQSCGLKLVVLFDGPKNPLKERTSNERLKGREEEWASLHKFCLNHSNSRNGNSFPLPPLCKEQLIAVLDKCSVRHLQCTYEADQEIALLVQQQNLSSATGIEWFAYALDTDYLIMKDCPYIEFGSVEVNGSVCAPVWTRVDVCRGLYITEEQFLDFVLFLGNDYTAPLIVHTDLYAKMHQVFNGNVSLIMQDWLRKVSKQQRAILRAVDLFRPLPPLSPQLQHESRMQYISQLQFAMDYSRALYNLEPLDHFYEQASLTLPPAVPYSSASCVFDFHHYSAASEGKFFVDLGRYVKAAEKMGTEGVDRGVAVHALTYLKRKGASSAATKPACPVVTDEHRAAIQMMLKQLQQRSQFASCNVNSRRPWKDLLAAYVYQKTCALMLKSFPNGAFVGEHNTPVKIFDDVIYHAMLRELRTAGGQSLTQTSVEPTQDGIPGMPTCVPDVPAVSLCEPLYVPACESSLQEERVSIETTRMEQKDGSLFDNLPNALRMTLKIEGNIDVQNNEGLSHVNTNRTFWIDDDSAVESVQLADCLNNHVASSPDNVPSNIMYQENSDPKSTKADNTEMGPEPAPRTVSPPSSPATALSSSLIGSAREVSLPSSTSVPAIVPRYQAPRPPPSLYKFYKGIRKRDRKAERRAQYEQDSPEIATTKARGRHVRRAPFIAPDYDAVPAPAPSAVPSNPFEDLPIDVHREAILRHIQSNRVTIIHGETGCGKSSRLPQFLLEDAECSHRHCKIFVSQPRRIGVVGMLKRLRPVLGDKVGMRMGHGVRDETAETKLHYVTTGYLVQLVAHHPEALKRCTHIVIDEVHERSVDGDLICLLVRDLLIEYSQLRVILMSATINTDLYQDYFSQYDDGSFGRMDGLSVGVKRFPVEIHYLEDLLTDVQTLQGRADEVRRLARKVAEEKALAPPWVEAQYSLVVALLRAVCRTGSTVLVFISGMDDITNIAALLEPYPQFLVCPLHSNTPEEEQDFVFEPTPQGNVKVVLATNMAESSVTIPDCDVVICLGTHKAVSFSDSLQRTHVAFGFISKASATQRAGRTGRVRPGTVYRLYTKETYQKMREHELAEVLRRPLDDVVLNMWTVLENAENFQGVTPFLNRLMEVPDVRYIDKSYEKLFEASLITFPSDDGNLTPAGRFVSALPLDLSLGRMLSYGVLLGVPAEAVVMAAALSLSRSPYRIASSIFLDPEQYNNQIRKRFLSEDYYNQGDYSEPIALIRLLLEWRALDSDKLRNSFCYKNSLQSSVMKQFDSTAVSLARETGRLQPSPSGTPLQISLDSIGTMSPRTANVLRLIMVWSFSENIMQLQRNDRKLKDIRVAKGTFRIESDRLTSTHLEALYGRIPYILTEHELDLCYSFSHKIDPFPQLAPLMDRLATVSDRNGARCFAIILESPDPEISEVFFIALPHETQSDLVEQFHCDVLSRERVADNQQALQLLNQCPNINQTDIVFTCSDASQSEVSNLFEFQRRLGDIITIAVSVNGLACLKSGKTMLSAETVASIYGVVIKKKKQLRTFVMSFPPEKRTTLSFPEEEEGEDEEERRSTRLIEDLPLGHRFMQCCRASRKDYKLVVKLQDAEATGDDRVEQGTEGPYKAKRAEKCPQRAVRVWSVTPAWQYFHNGSHFPARFPRQSTMSASFHCGPNPLFAVAHSALPVTKLTGTSFVVSGVTFLPTDPIWLRLAMRTMGKDHVLNHLWEEASKEEGLEPPQALLDLARDIDNDVQDVNDFLRRDDIIEKVHMLFASLQKSKGSDVTKV